ncbi:MAG: hypothetical protein KG003_08065 [Bacteroidetes bacterium]|nr:hypothetical protein [Bacteroidota bacterium]
MHPVTPVFPDNICKHPKKGEESFCPDCGEVFVAEKQEEYQTLPVIYIEGGNSCISRWELSEEEIKHIIETKSIYLIQSNFGKAIAPMMISCFPDGREI